MFHTHPEEFNTGIYEHYKGSRYRVLGTVQHSETEEWLVLYQALYGSCGFWVRPLEMFCEQVLIAGKSQPRFKLVETDSTRSLQAIAEPSRD